MSDVRISTLSIEHLHEYLGIGIPEPRVSWQIETDIENWLQTGYELVCFDEDGNKQGTGRVESDRSVLVAWPFAALRSRERLGLQVRVWGKEDSRSDWSEVVRLEAGLLSPEDWDARFITPDWQEDGSKSNPVPYLRTAFVLDKPIERARLYITCLGVYEAQLNGRRVSEDVFAPGWTVYDRRVRYQTYDVGTLLNEGRNGFGVRLADGWYRGRLGFGGGRRNIYGERLGLLAQLEVHYQDGTSERIGTDGTWRATTGAILSSCIYDGENYDARLEPQGWAHAGFDDGDWAGVELLEQDMSVLEAPLGPPVRRTQMLEPVAITQSPSGKTLVDFGQNLVGRVSVRVRGEAGRTITLRHAEVLEHGELGTRPLRFAEATDRFTLAGEGVETYEPFFTFHGFRYVEVDGWPGTLSKEDITAVVLHSDLSRTGWFECSDPMLDRLHDNIVWGMRGNFLDVPTDCPQRDERLGWTGDIQVFAPTASFLYDVSGFLQSWLRDLAIEQEKSGGSVPHVVPDILHANGAAAWGDAAVIVPWVLYERYGDKDILASQYESMKAWIAHMARAAGENHLWDEDFQFGDWLDPSAPPDKPFLARTSKEIVATAYFAYSTRIVAQVAGLLGRSRDRRHYSELADKVQEAFARQYVTPAGRMVNDAETAYTLAIMFDLLPTAEQRQNAGDRLAELVHDGGYHIRTGFVGTPLICDALSSTGHHQTAYRLLTQRSCPSWLYPITMGATTVWERWDSMLPDGSINPGEMTSFNHYALGSVADWMHRVIGGLAPAEPAYRTIRFAPRPGGGLTHCRTRLDTPYGEASAEWSITDDRFDLSVVVPPNTRALVSLPGALEHTEAGSGTWRWSVAYRDPDERGPLTIDDRVGDILFARKGQEKLREALEAVGAPDFVFAIVQNERSLPLRKALAMLPNHEEALPKVEQALERLNVELRQVHGHSTV